MGEDTPTTEDVLGAWVGQSPCPQIHRTPEQFHAWLAEHDTEVARVQCEMDDAMHQAYRPEVVAEVAVILSDECDWDAVARWCGGTIHTGCSTPSGEYTSSIVIPGVGEAWQGSWIVQRHDLSFAIRAEVAGPSGASASGAAQRAAEWLRVRDVAHEVIAASQGNGHTNAWLLAVLIADAVAPTGKSEEA